MSYRPLITPLSSSLLIIVIVRILYVFRSILSYFGTIIAPSSSLSSSSYRRSRIHHYATRSKRIKVAAVTTASSSSSPTDHVQWKIRDSGIHFRICRYSPTERVTDLSSIAGSTHCLHRGGNIGSIPGRKRRRRRRLLRKMHNRSSEDQITFPRSRLVSAVAVLDACKKKDKQ